MQEIQSSWKSILNKYGGNALFVEGDDLQSTYRFTFDINYLGLDGSFAFSWSNTKHDYYERRKYRWLAEDDPRKIHYNYGGRTILTLALSTQHGLKIFDNGMLINLLSRFHPNRVKTGYLNFDNAFITIARPTSIVPGLMPYLQYLLDPALGVSLVLDTDWQDAVTTKFYLRLQVNKLLTEEQILETLLEKSYKLIKQLEL